MDYTCENKQPSGEKMQQGTLLTVVGGRVVTSSYSSNGQFPINGQQLMMQLESLTSSMMDMAVTTDEVEMEEVIEENVQETKTASPTMLDENILSDEHLIQQKLVQLHQEQIQQQYELEQQHEQEHQRQLQLEQQGKLMQQQLPNFGLGSTPACLMAIPSLSAPQKCIMWL